MTLSSCLNPGEDFQSLFKPHAKFSSLLSLWSLNGNKDRSQTSLNTPEGMFSSPFLTEKRVFYGGSKRYNVHLAGVCFCQAGGNLGRSRQECISSFRAHRKILTAIFFFNVVQREKKINIPESIVALLFIFGGFQLCETSSEWPLWKNS